VVVLLAVFAVFIIATLVDLDPHLLAFSGYPPFSVDPSHRGHDPGSEDVVPARRRVVTVAVAALLATASSVNATLFASGGLTAMLADVGQFPPFFGRGSPLGSNAGLLITPAIVLVVSNVVDLSAIASVGSACSLLIFLATSVVLVFFAVDMLRNAPQTFVAIVAIAVLAVILDAVWKRVRPEPTPATTPAPFQSSGA
jgi:hypothetical protein